ncbi:hypothetical protein [Pseudomonas sp. PDM32]|uniref:hypothetical protein n=1 Tax=Pseudomonas sp. PDM32 TaxID=2854768 RepID=UPI00210F0784|nr:hypothetical protein [Pseudomonas sp. PDM32]
MNGNIEKSFIAILRMFDHKVNVLELLHGKPAMATIRLFSGGSFIGRPQPQDHSHLLGIRPNEQIGEVTSLKLHFLHTADGYILTIKNKGDYYNRIISENWIDTFEAMDSDTDEPTAFTLLNHQGAVVTLDNLPATHSQISLKIEDKHYMGGLKVNGSPYVYLGKTEERSKITFILTILERKAPRT